MAVFIRHANDDRIKFEDTTNDTSLTRLGKRHAKKTCKQLYSQIGVPAEIRCSSYNRCRETAQEMVDYLYKNYRIKVTISVDYRLSRFTGSGSGGRVRQDTADYGYIAYESHDAFVKRAHKYAARAVQKHLHSGRVVWYVSHAIFVKNAARRHYANPPKTLNSCAWVDLITRRSSW